LVEKKNLRYELDYRYESSMMILRLRWPTSTGTQRRKEVISDVESDVEKGPDVDYDNEASLSGFGVLAISYADNNDDDDFSQDPGRQWG
jgi:hypothetical protein